MKYLQDTQHQSLRKQQSPRIVYVNKYDTVSSQLDDLTITANNLRDVYEKKISMLTTQNSELQRRNDELIDINNCLMQTEEIEQDITNKLRIYTIDEE